MSETNRIKGNYHEPETLQDTHRPVGPPRAREYKSQKAQLESLPHGEQKDVKRGISYKTGLEDWEEKARLAARREEGNDLQDRVQALLDTDKDLRGYGLKAEVNGQRVQLSGIVDSLAEKERAAELVAGVPGVTAVENGLAISTDGAITDAEVAEEVREELEADPQVDLRHIGAESHGGNVILTGSVTDPQEKEAARRAAAKARGVRRVLDQVKVKDAGEMTLKEAFHSQVRNDGEPLP